MLSDVGESGERPLPPRRLHNINTTREADLTYDLDSSWPKDQWSISSRQNGPCLVPELMPLAAGVICGWLTVDNHEGRQAFLNAIPLYFIQKVLFASRDLRQAILPTVYGYDQLN